jgi:hypothetical protein
MLLNQELLPRMLLHNDHMKGRRATIYAVTGLLLSSVLLWNPTTAIAQQAAGSFADAAKLLQSGDVVLVTNTAGVQLRGRVITVTDERLELMTSTQQLRILGPDVKTMSRQNPDSILNGGLIGMAIGAVPGVWLTGVRYGGSDPVGGKTATVIVLPALAGFAVGALVDSALRSWATVYESVSGGTARAVLSPLLTRTRVGVQVSLLM